MRIKHETEILKPPGTVFPWIAEPEKALKWQKDVKRAEIINNEPDIVGTTFKELVEEDGNGLEISGVITKFIKNKMIEFHLESKVHVMDVSYSVEEMNKATKVSVEVIIKWKFPMNVVSLFIGKRMEAGLLKKMKVELNELKKFCEAG